jgi:uncharacterized protein (DUF4213/DUF364 family)
MLREYTNETTIEAIATIVVVNPGKKLVKLKECDVVYMTSKTAQAIATPSPKM